MEIATLQSMHDILKRMIVVCPVRNIAYIRMDSDNPYCLFLEWRWKIDGRPLFRSIKISLIDIKTAQMDIIQLEIDSLKDANWELSERP